MNNDKNKRSNNLRDMSDIDIRELKLSGDDISFSDVSVQLKRLYQVIKKESIGLVLTESDENVKRLFEYGYCGYDEFFKLYGEQNYKGALNVLKRDILSLHRQTNDSRMAWGIGTGIKTELRRRGLE